MKLAEVASPTFANYVVDATSSDAPRLGTFRPPPFQQPCFDNSLTAERHLLPSSNIMEQYSSLPPKDLTKR